MSGNCKIPSGETKIDGSQIGTKRVPRWTTRDRRAFRCGRDSFESVSVLRIGAIARAYTAALKAESTRAFLTLPFGDSRPRPPGGFAHPGASSDTPARPRPGAAASSTG